MSGMTQANSCQAKERKKNYEVIQIQTLWNAEGMIEEIPVEGLAS